MFLIDVYFTKVCQVQAFAVVLKGYKGLKHWKWLIINNNKSEIPDNCECQVQYTVSWRNRRYQIKNQYGRVIKHHRVCSANFCLYIWILWCDFIIFVLKLILWIFYKCCIEMGHMLAIFNTYVFIKSYLPNS